MTRSLRVRYQVTFEGDIWVEEGESIEDHIFEMHIPHPAHYMVDNGFDVIEVTTQDGEPVNWENE